MRGSGIVHMARATCARSLQGRPDGEIRGCRVGLGNNMSSAVPGTPRAAELVKGRKEIHGTLNTRDQSERSAEMRGKSQGDFARRNAARRNDRSFGFSSMEDDGARTSLTIARRKSLSEYRDRDTTV